MEKTKWTKLCGSCGGSCPEYCDTEDGGVEIRDLDRHDKVIVLNKTQIEILFANLSLSK
jgi:hypothetical protein